MGRGEEGPERVKPVPDLDLSAGPEEYQGMGSLQYIGPRTQTLPIKQSARLKGGAYHGQKI